MMNDRIAKLIAALPADFDAALVKTEVNRFYFLDFSSHDAGTLLILPGGAHFIIDARYHEAAQKAVSGAEVLLETRALEQVKALLSQAGAKKLYLEEELTVAQYEKYRAALPGVEVDACPTLSRAILLLRMVKDDEELRRMRQAQEITDACFEHILPHLRVGVREVDIMLEMEFFMRKNGAERAAFDIICVAGKNSSLPHGVPGENRIEPGDFVTLDFGAVYEGYCTDMTRTLAVGEPDEEKRAVYDLVLKAHYAGLRAASAQKRGNEVDRAARGVIEEAGYGEYFTHGLGHAVGIEVHEPPRFSPLCEDSLKAGMTMTVEPGIYLPGRFGCRIEDTVLLNATDCTPLPSSPKELMVLPG